MRASRILSALRDHAARSLTAACLALLAPAAAGQQPPIVPDPNNHVGMDGNTQMCDEATALEISGCNYIASTDANGTRHGWAGWRQTKRPEEIEPCRQACLACCDEHSNVPDIGRFLTSAVCECYLATRLGGRPNPLSCGGPQLVDLMHLWGDIDEPTRKSLRRDLRHARGIWALGRVYRRIVLGHPDPLVGRTGPRRESTRREGAETTEEYDQQWNEWARGIGTDSLQGTLALFGLCESMHQAADQGIYRSGCQERCNNAFTGQAEPPPPPPRRDDGSDDLNEIEYLAVPAYENFGAIWGSRAGTPNVFTTDESWEPCIDPVTGGIQEDCPSLQ